MVINQVDPGALLGSKPNYETKKEAGTGISSPIPNLKNAQQTSHRSLEVQRKSANMGHAARRRKHAVLLQRNLV